MVLFTKIMTGCGFSSKVNHECLLKKTQDDTVLAVAFTIKCFNAYYQSYKDKSKEFKRRVGFTFTVKIYVDLKQLCS